MSKNPNLLVQDIQSLEIASPLVELFEVEFDSTTTLYLHPGVDDTIRVSKIDGSVITLNSLTDVTSGTTLTFTGTNSQDGSATSITKTVSGSNPNNNTITYSIQRTLQNLRDDGKIVFIDRGVYGWSDKDT